MNLIVVIGRSGSGKTTWVKRNYLTREMVLVTDPIKHTVGLNTILLGDYTLNQRTLGTDTIAYNMLPQIINFVYGQLLSHKTVVAEGDRINNRKFFNFLLEHKLKFELHYFTCSLETAYKRLKEAGSKQTVTFMKATATKSENTVKWLKGAGSNIITHNTEEICL